MLSPRLFLVLLTNLPKRTAEVARFAFVIYSDIISSGYLISEGDFLPACFDMLF